MGRYHGLEKAYRKMQSELKKAKPSRGIESTQETVDHLLTGDEPIADVLMLNESGRMSDENQSSDLVDKPSCPTMPPRQAHTAVQDTVQQPDFASPRAAFMHNDEANRSDQEPLSNPLALLADASGVAQTAEPGSTPMSASLGSNDESSAKRLAADFSARRNPSHHLLRRPGYVSLGLQLGRDTLEHGLDALFSSTERKYSDYFKPPIRAPFPDTGADVDPIDLGLVTMEEAYYLFPMYVATCCDLSVQHETNPWQIFCSVTSDQWNFGPNAPYARLRTLSVSVVIHMDTCAHGPIRPRIWIDCKAITTSWRETLKTRPYLRA